MSQKKILSYSKYLDNSSAFFPSPKSTNTGPKERYSSRKRSKNDLPKMQYLNYAHALQLLFIKNSVPTSLGRGMQSIIHFT